MAERIFGELISRNQADGKLVCIGYDPDLDKLPERFTHVRGTVPDNPRQLDPEAHYQRTCVYYDFLKPITDTTHHYACAIKPNIAFYEHSDAGEEALSNTIWYVNNEYPHIPIIGDVKRADIGNTNKGYAEMAFDRYGFDAITVNPYFGHDTYDPFYKYPGKGIIVLCKTTNPGAALYQDAPIDIYQYQREQILKGSPMTNDEMDLAQMAAREHYSETLVEEMNKEEKLTDDQKQFLEKHRPDSKLLPMYQVIALRTATLAAKHPEMTFGLVVGATHPEAFKPVRLLAPNLLFLIPGIGKQGGDLEATLKFAGDNIVINSSSGIIFASKGIDFALAAQREAMKLHEQIRSLKAA